MAQSGDEYDVGISRIHRDLADLPGFFQADVLPGLAAIARFVHAIAAGQIGTDVGFAGSGIDDVRVRGRYREGSDRADGLAVEDGSPNSSRIVGLPDAPIYAPEIKC